MTIADICHRNVITVKPTDELVNAARLMRARHVGYLVVMEAEVESGERRVVGVLTDRDIVVGVIARDIDPRSLTVGDVMTRHPVTVTQTQPVTIALAEMRRIGVRRLPVLGEHERLVGVIAVDDILAALAEVVGDVSLALGREQQFEAAQRPGQLGDY